MNNWLTSSSRLTNKLFTFLLILTLLGIADATYLTATHYLGEEVVCSVTKGCEQVLTSKYATVFDMPISLLGVVYYSVLFLLVYYFRLTGEERFWRALQIILITGMLSTLYLVYLQLFVLKAICQYCMISAGLTTILLITVFIKRPEGIQPLKQK